MPGAHPARTYTDGTITWLALPDGSKVQLPASGGGGGVTDHGDLTGLADDDHPQYHTDARGDARYVNVTGDTMTGELVISRSLNTSLIVDTPSGYDAGVRAGWGTAGEQARWKFGKSGDEAEGAGNVGSDFVISRYANDGSSLGNAVRIERHTGVIMLPEVPDIPVYRGDFQLSANQSIPSNTFTIVKPALVTQEGGLSVNASGEITVPVSGLWMLSSWSSFAGNATGGRFGYIMRNGVRLIRSSVTPGAGSVTVSCTRIVRLTAGDKMTSQVYQGSGAALDLDSSNNATGFDLVYLNR